MTTGNVSIRLEEQESLVLQLHVAGRLLQCVAAQTSLVLLISGDGFCMS